ncbi:hypothetical protein B0H12DRAFT_71828 [Mycena haematopus]|nr:hypothetical protein B0H12DRAFT_71828 [Mycena haematopus]
MTITSQNVDQERCGNFLWDLAHKANRDNCSFDLSTASRNTLDRSRRVRGAPYHCGYLQVFQRHRKTFEQAWWTADELTSVKQSLMETREVYDVDPLPFWVCFNDFCFVWGVRTDNSIWQPGFFGNPLAAPKILGGLPNRIRQRKL